MAHFGLTREKQKKAAPISASGDAICHCCQPRSVSLLKSGAHFSCLQCPPSVMMGIQRTCKPVCSLQQSVIITSLLVNCWVSSSTEQTERQKITSNRDSQALIMSGPKANSTKHT